VPPETIAVTVPSLAEQVASVLVADALIELGAFIVTDVLSVQAFASVTVTS
jgi:hypothetical protein